MKRYISAKKLTSFIQSVAWKCRKLKRASLIHSTGSVRGVIRIRRTTNERFLPVKSENELIALYPDFVFRNT